MITIGISETNKIIQNLTKQLLSDCGRHCSSSLQKTDRDFIFCTPKPKKHYDILIENDLPAPNAKSDYIHLVNSDAVLSLPTDEHSVWITYGLNPFATVTASSIVTEENHLHFHYCLQRDILSLRGKRIECQEFPVSVFQKDADLHSALACVSLALIVGIAAKQLVAIGRKA